MDILFIWISVPVFYIIGLVGFVKWLARGGGSESNHVRKQVAAQLRDRAGLTDGAARDELLLAADDVLAGVPSQAVSTVVRTNTHDLPALTSSYNADAGLEPVSTRQAATQPASWWQQDFTASLHSLDNINLILFLGAFLVVVSAGIFIGYNFETLSGGFKTIFLGIFATIFYATGLSMYRWSTKLRPAGITFTGIGLILIPLVGLAAYNFTSAHDVPAVTWFVTSIITFVLYAIALMLTRQTYVTYMMAFTTLSLFESAVKLFSVPVYWYGWVMAVVGLMLLIVSRWGGWWEEAASSLAISANIFVPISLLISLVELADQGLWQIGITLGLAGIYYALMAWLDRTKPAAVWYVSATLSALPLVIVCLTWDTWSHPAVAMVLLMISAGYLMLNGLLHHRLPRSWQIAAGVVAGLIPLLGIMISLDNPRTILACLLGGVVVNVAFAIQLRQTGLAFMASLAALAIPYELIHEVQNLPDSWQTVAIGYLVLVPVLYLWRQYIRTWADSPQLVGIGSYAVAISLALLFAAYAGQTSFFAIALVSAAIIYALGILERLTQYGYVAAAVMYLALTQAAAVFSIGDDSTAVVMMAAGALLYAVAYLSPSKARAQVLRYAGIAGPLLGAMFGMVGSGYAGPFALLVTGGLVLAEAYQQHQDTWAEGAVGIMLLALNWFLMRGEVTNAQLYTLPWAAYLAALAYRRRSNGHEVYDGFVAAALGFLTLPIAMQALASDGQMYGLELIAVALGLVAVGAGLHYKLVSWWGAGTLIAETLYQMRDVIFAIPKYVISAGLGLALLVVAVVLLSRRKSD